jgi:S1-C subfamily serine protease
VLCPAIRNHRLIEFSNRKIPGLDDFDLALLRFSAGETIDVTALRAGKPVKLKVTLGVPAKRRCKLSPANGTSGTRPG